ncbi:TPA: hypothetical protein SB189_001163 [Campylobacter coli]|nr:hypothetical protein [Campylobacter coli]HEF9822825.1 hypothetical protein [Campylobacter coli]HEF9834667.1 hypothetical protein [Campylobacter coli]HEF9912354.1 hypothetical protein [Campylobacter coli]HEG0028104.1 hypothetical protein [Campylobacter coli]
MKTFNCNIEINKNKIKQPKFSFNEKDLCDVDLNNNTCIFSTSGAGYSYIINFLYQYIRAKDENTKIVFVSNQSSGLILDYWFAKDKNVEYCDFEYEKLLSLYKTKSIVICVFLHDKGLFDSQKYDITDVGNLIFASSINKIFGFTTKSFKEMIIKCNTNNLLKNESAFESIELKKEEEEEKFTLDFLIESNKTSVLSVFKGKII